MRFVTTAIIVGMVAMLGWVAAEASAEQVAGSSGGSFAYVDILRVFAESSEGQIGNARVEELSQQKRAEIEARNTEAQDDFTALNQELQEAQQNLAQGQNVISQEAAATLQREITRLQRDTERTMTDAQADIQRMTQDATVEVQELEQQLESEFDRRLRPALDQLGTQQGLSIIFRTDQGLVWADSSLDLTQQLITLVNNPVIEAP
jgi:Skp family chaperone for outer membrane proteins